MTAVSIPAIIRGIVLVMNRKSRAVPYCVRSEIPDSEQPYTVYFERIRTVEGLILCAIGIYSVSLIHADPIYTFSGEFVWQLILGLIFLALGLPLCFCCSAGCAAISAKRVIIYRTRCFFKKTLTAIPRKDIKNACRISAGRKGAVSAFFSMISAFLKGDRKTAVQKMEAAFLSGYLEVSTAKDTHRIRLSSAHADYALSDIAQLCRSESTGGEKISRSYSVLPHIIPAAAALIFVIISGIALTSGAKDAVERRYLDAVYLEDTQSFSQAYVEFEHLSEQYGYRDSAFRAAYCYARLELYQENYESAAEKIKALPDFEEKSELLYSCALMLSEGESAAKAAELFESLGEFEDSKERLAHIEEVYSLSVAAYENGDYLTAAEGFTILRDYKNTAEYVSLLAQEADRLVPNAGNPENLESKQILERCAQALPILEALSWDSRCASLKALCEEYISIYTFD